MWVPNPVAFQFGPIAIRWYGILISSALALGTYLACREAKKQNIDPEQVINIAIYAAPLGFLGARIYYVLFSDFAYYLAHPAEIIAVWHGGLAIHGGLVGGILGGYWAVRRYRMNFWKMADIIAPSLVLGQAIGRWGNFFNQEAYGYETSLPWAMYIDGAYRHPTFLYESIWDLTIFILLILIRRKPMVREGDLFAGYLMMYSLGRIFFEHFRTDSLMLGPFRIAQLVSLLGIILGIIMIWFHHRIPGPPGKSAAPPKAGSRKGKKKKGSG